VGVPGGKRGNVQTGGVDRVSTLSLLGCSTSATLATGPTEEESSPATGPEWPTGFQEVKVPRFRDNGTGWW